MRIKNNIDSMRSYRNYSTNNKGLSKDLEKLSTGYKINRSADDAAGLAISEKMRAQITGIEGAVKNAKDGISLVQTAEGALTEVHGILDRMTSLAEQSANGTYDNEVDRAQLQKEVESLKSEVDRIADSSNYNGIKLLDGSLNGGAVSLGGVSLEGRNVSHTQAGSLKTGVLLTDFSAIDPVNASIDYIRLDGKTVEINYADNKDARELAGFLKNNLNTVTPDEVLETVAEKFEKIINESATAQGVNASVKVRVEAVNGKLVFESANKTPASEFSYIGNNATDENDAKNGVMHSLLEGSTGQANHAVLGPSQNTYDGNKVDTADKFHMTINGVSVGVSVPSAINDGEAMSSAAAKLTTAVQNAVGDYNSARGLSEGVYDEKSGLTGLTKNEFTVKEGDNGNFQVLYSGKEPVEFSFSDVGERTVAQGLGLATGGSSGGAGALSLQIGDTAEDYNSVWVSVEDMHTTALGIKSVDVSTQNGASEAMKSIKEAINKVSDARGGLGALQNKLEHTIGNLGVMRENIQNAESLIRDTDVAEQMMSYTKNNILNQSAQAMLAQANQLPQGVMQLLQG